MKGEAVSRVACAGPIRASGASEDIPHSGRESAEGFTVCCAVTVSVATAAVAVAAVTVPVAAVADAT